MFAPIYYLKEDYIKNLFKTRAEWWKFLGGLSNNHNPDVIKELKKFVTKYNKSNVCLNSKAGEIHRWLASQNALNWEDWCNLSAYSEDVDFLEQNIENISMSTLCLNPHAIRILEKYPEKLNYVCLLQNPKAIHLLETNFIENLCKYNVFKLSAFLDSCYKNENATKIAEKILEIHLTTKKLNSFYISEVSLNPYLIPFLEKHPELINWNNLCLNPNAIHLLESNINKINWNMLSRNPNAIPLIEKHLDIAIDKLNWTFLSREPNAVHLLEQHLDKVCWMTLCENPKAVYIIKKHFDKIDKRHLLNFSFNHNEEVIDLLKENIHHVDLRCLGKNPNVLKIVGTLDYDAMKIKCQPFAQELATYVLNPTRLLRLCDAYGLDLEEYMEIIGD